MRFLLHGKVNAAVKAAVERHGHAALSPAEVGIAADASASDLFLEAHQKQLDLITDDRDLAAYARETALKYDRAIVYLHLPGDDVEQDDAIDRLFARYKSPKPRQLYTVTETRVKVQQLKPI